MRSRDSETQIDRAAQMSVQMEVTPEQHSALQEWAASIPVLFFLDICVVNLAKTAKDTIERDARKASLVDRLRSLDRPQHAFSYLLALIEKVSDPRSELSDQELEAQVLGDVAALRAFFKNARVQEPDDFLVNYLRELRRNPHERMRSQYLTYLGIVNSQFALRNPVAPRRRFKMAQAIVQEADRMSVARQHPLVLLTLACLYGNVHAKKIMKFKADAAMFDAENALADIMVISRFLPLKLEIEDHGRNEGGYPRCEFITDDGGLLGVLKCFQVEAVTLKEKSDVLETRTDVRVNFLELLTDLASSRQDRSELNARRDEVPDEFEKICELILQPPNALPETL